ncbi:P-loop NTPase fold protein [Sulfuriroseicoccus oceanibius]|uniref:KAP NTPase domain-containing protein n=1 Tax=Sulfuriroseicoccus oceanibius TaxID=2707525 RepID=A0A6B3LAJ1_9BACT|nr:P-loop NTPase fold protein [Sulfuriroseicoccus oceanibius]QQL43933.1 hypothetical protein G3M56_008485 [Sulfuriroseicoccus oceanibius]
MTTEKAESPPRFLSRIPVELQTAFSESIRTHHFRHLSLCIALILIGVCCSHLDIQVFNIAWNSITQNAHAIIWSTVIASLSFFGFCTEIRSRALSYLVVYWHWVWNILFVLLLPFIAYRIFESHEHVNSIGALAAILITAWPLSLIGPISEKLQQNEPKVQSDKLERQMYVDKFADFLAQNLSNSSIQFSRIAISATWGTGKTDFILRVVSKLNELNSSQSSRLRYCTHVLCPWQAKTHTEAHEEIIRGIDKALGIRSPSRPHIAKLVHTLLGLVGIKSPASRISDILKSSNVLLNDLKLRQIDHLLKHSRKRVIVFIDDMERVNEEQIKKIFPALNQIKKLEYCCFVFAIDTDRLQNAFTSNEEAKGYINKTFDYHLSLPAPEKREIIKLARSEVRSAQHPFLHRSIQNLELVFPRTPRALKQWLAICQAKEEMFFKGNYEYDEKNFPAFFLKELIEYEFPGFEFFLRSEELDSLTEKNKRNAYDAWVMNYFRGEPSSPSNDSKDSQPSPEDLFFEYSIDGRKRRLGMLYETLIKLIETDPGNARFSFAWACSEYTMIAGLTLKYRSEIQAQLLENPSSPIEKIIEAAHKDSSQADPEATADQFFSYFLSEQVADRIKSVRTTPSQASTISRNLEALASHIDHQDHLPQYLENRHQSFLENFGVLQTLTDKDIKHQVQAAMIRLLEAWSLKFPLPELRGLLIRTTTEGWEFQYGIRAGIAEADTPPWKQKIEHTLRNSFSAQIAELSLEEDFPRAYRQVYANRDFYMFFSNDAPLLASRDAIAEHIGDGSFSNSFLDTCLYALFDPEILHSDFEGNIRLRKNREGYFSFLAMSAAESIPIEIVNRHQKKIKESYKLIKDDDLRQWVRENLLGNKVSKILKLT